ncbi:MAG: UDP-N-acetylmuramoyl-L-alanyl-D-glutamate--2,6-diaminopimelate ligase [Sedimentisphaerales bacterium]|nr:UDP-N-acetylmuramoyl-L-alanyl-D-glutamate--2,6-diaminopimelate ligase [Sedimentisphaerales bacterium]
MTYDEILKLLRSPQKPGLCVDSRLVKPDNVFVAVKGPNLDGHDFIPQALANGAKFIVCQNPSSSVIPAQAGIQFIHVPDSSFAFAQLAQAANGDPASKLTNLAVTGTNGKTTVTFLVRSCLRAAGCKCGLIGTVTYDTGLESSPADLTTPDPLTIARMQARMLEAGDKFMVIEASSHSLDQNRLTAIDFKAAAFTNLTGDHLDYHKSTENYLAAKTKLFHPLSSDSIAIINKQSPYAQRIADITKAGLLWFALDEPADLSAHIDSIDISGTIFTLSYHNETIQIKSPLLGQYNVSNHLAAAGLCLAAGLDLKTIAEGLSSLAAIPGRLENVKPDAPFTVLVDFAHTDDALNNVLSTLKPLCKGRLVVLFGCGGDRDKTKRPRMAKVVENFADLVIVTSDNPRTENPDDIISQIVAGFKDPDSPKIKIEPDRRKAIAFAIESARKDDVVLIAGKGHETCQIIGRQKLPFSDKLIALDSLENRCE